jgi:two-component system sensor histidine kinase/response regulator
VDLPPSEEEATQAEKRKVVGLALDQPPPRVLVVDDTLNNRMLLSKLLLSAGVQVREAANGQDAIAVWSAWRPQLIFMDLRMPVLDGYEATRQIRAQETKIKNESDTMKDKTVAESNCSFASQPEAEMAGPVYRSSVMFNSLTKIIALTASAFEHERGAIIEQGADDFVAKPFREEIIFEKLALHLGTRFRYEEMDESKAAAKIRPNEDTYTLTPERFGVVSTDILARLEHALRLGDDAAASHVARELQATDPALAAAIERSVKSFDFDLVLRAIVSGKQ